MVNLTERIEKHLVWLKSDGLDGERLVLVNADLRGADLSSADLSMSSADLRGADLRGADLSGADLSDADLSYADLSNANLYGADLRGADLRNVNLRWANLSYADLRDASLSHASLRDANLRGADLSDTDLQGVIGIISVNFDTRGYTLVAWMLKDEVWFNAGCRSLSAKDALAHWGGAKYANLNRGDTYCEFIRFLNQEVLWNH